MLQRYVLVANAIISFIFGLGLIFAANAVLGLYGGMSMEPVTDQLFGAALVGTAVLNVLGATSQLATLGARSWARTSSTTRSSS
jgi:hypothetical protein